VLNNYFSVGIDAEIALQFHRARNSNPDHFTSRTRNLIFYTLEGGKDLVRNVHSLSTFQAVTSDLMTK
jgi:diacylglycerol kinase (ATP)